MMGMATDGRSAPKHGVKHSKNHNNYKTTPCLHWVQHGACKYGADCHFAHGEAELRPRHPKAPPPGKLGMIATAMATHNVGWNSQPTHEISAGSSKDELYSLPPSGRPPGKGWLHTPAGVRCSGMAELQTSSPAPQHGYYPQQHDQQQQHQQWQFYQQYQQNGNAPFNHTAMEGSPYQPHPVPPTWKLSEEALELLKQHKRRMCVDLLVEMGFATAKAEEAAAAAGCDAHKATQLLTEGTMGPVAGWRFVAMAPKPVDVSREAEALRTGAIELGYGPHEAEAVLEHAQGDWERALEELQARRAVQESAAAAAHQAPPVRLALPAMPGWDEDLAASTSDPTAFTGPSGLTSAAYGGFPAHKPSMGGTARAASSHQPAGTHPAAAQNPGIAAVNFPDPPASGGVMAEIAGQPADVEADEEELQHMLSLLCT